MYPSVVTVAPVDLRLAGDHRAWDISWDSMAGNAMETTDFSCVEGANITAAYTGEGTCSTELVEASAGGASVSGTFSLTVSWSTSTSTIANVDDTAWAGAAETTADLTYDATAAEVKAALEALSGVAAADVELVNSLPNDNRGGGSSYLVTFPGAYGATSPVGGLTLTASAAGLDGTGASATVREVYPGSRWGGEFTLSFGGLEGSALPFDANAEEVQEAVSSLVALASGDGAEDGRSVEVWREESDVGFRWAVEFSGGDLDGDIDLMEVSALRLARSLLSRCTRATFGTHCSSRAITSGLSEGRQPLVRPDMLGTSTSKDF